MCEDDVLLLSDDSTSDTPLSSVEESQALIHQLSVPHRAKSAYHALFAAGFASLPAVLSGLKHENADVRYHCVRLLDHFVVPEVLGDLYGMVCDPDPRVRSAVLHSLACDKCKKGECRPTEAEVLPVALTLLSEDSDRYVRAMAVEVVGHYVHKSPLAAQALIEAHKNDANSTVRKKAGWYAPGGSIYRRTAPRPLRKQPPVKALPAPQE